MLYKFGLEAFNGSIVTLATNRYDQDASNANKPSQTFQQIGLLVGLNQAFQCVGSVLIAPLVRRWPTRTVLSISIVAFAIFTAILMIIDGATGGHIKPANFTPKHKNDFSYYGHYKTDVIIAIYCVTGIAYGMVELIRRIIPRDIVGGDVEKLQRMDSLVHVFYEVSGTAGAFATALGLIPRLGNNYAFIITPICFTASGIVWFFLGSLTFSRAESEESDEKESNYVKSILKKIFLFGKSVYVGGRLIFTQRKFIWLWSGYSVALYAHRYLENGIAPQVAKRYMEDSAWSQIIVGGSNFGELIGAFVVFICASFVRTPMPWLRLDAILLMIVCFNLTEARQALCLIVGYRNSHYCPGINETIDGKRKARITPLPALPLSRGVGMAIDISLGFITLPALELTYSDGAENKWIDPYSKQSCRIGRSK
ncbi:unnamed protein product [Rotaria sordida]|uniref:Uncharacterized protein n=1 Tax=Rotaria sordida TaxID=392033 RepID=A0A818WQ16_9BILA|nr:unnamed protein product [Rotaria sordida]CAF3726931.1 unnamed protein product [Rotaria sordida]